MTVTLSRIDYLDPRAIDIRALMDLEMGALYEGWGDDSPELGPLIDAALTVHPEDMIATVGVLDGERLVGHAAVRRVLIDPQDADSHDAELRDAASQKIASLEVKRVIVLEEYRGRGLSKQLMLELERIALGLGITSMVLQTGPRQLPAIALYESIGYRPIPRFGLYKPIEGFLCFGKSLDPELPTSVGLARP